MNAREGQVNDMQSVGPPVHLVGLWVDMEGIEEIMHPRVVENLMIGNFALTDFG